LQAILADERRDRFFEAHAENYMGAGSPLQEPSAVQQELVAVRDFDHTDVSCGS
jgi:uncharacterized protein (UPF0276 family)